MATIRQISIILLSLLFWSCEKEIDGCRNPQACNYNQDATNSDGSCIFLSDKIEQGYCNCRNDIYDECYICGGDGLAEDEDCDGPACNVGEQEFIASFPFSTTGTTQGLASDFPPDYGYDYDQDDQTGADYAYGISLESSSYLTIDLCGSRNNYNYDTFLYLFNANNCDNIYLIDSNDDRNSDDCDSLDSYLNIFLNPGNYYIVVAGYGGYEGRYNISVRLE